MKGRQFTYRIGESKPVLIMGISYYDVKQKVMANNSGLKPEDIIVERADGKEGYTYASIRNSRGF